MTLHAVKLRYPPPLRSLPWGSCSAPPRRGIRARRGARNPGSGASLQRSVSVTEQAVDKVKVWPFKARGPPFTQVVCSAHFWGPRNSRERRERRRSPGIALAREPRGASSPAHSAHLRVLAFFVRGGASSGMGPCGSQELNSSQRQSSSCAGQRTVGDLSAEVALASSGSAVPRKRSWFNRPREPRKASRDIIGHSPLPTQAFPLSLRKHDPAKILPSFHFHCVPALLQT